MKFYSTNNKKLRVSLKDAVLMGLARDGGLFMPEKISRLPARFFKTIERLSFQDLSYQVVKPFFKRDVPLKTLKNIINDAFNFTVPLVQLTDHIYSLELFHGPTLSFKDFGARFMARLTSYLMRNSKQGLTILVATSGDTGSAVANGFLNVEGICVSILYPSKKITEIQEKQITTLGNNITALEIQGTFDDCQKLVKQAFLDEELAKEIRVTSANSINVARLIPQSCYYMYAYAQLKNKQRPVVISVPSGNFGNLVAGFFAQKMGLPVSQFIGATNINNIVPHYLETGKFRPLPSKKTISNAMDVGNPSNFARMLDLHDSDVKKMRSHVWGAHFSDDQTREAIVEVFQNYNYVLDTHVAVGYLGLQEYLNKHPRSIQGIFLETAHPAKFLDSVQPLLDQKITIPPRLQKCLEKQKQSVLLSNNYPDFKSYLLSHS
ncbi:threonine synthase [Patescibacteria group bacterium AH-259-L07]|nr:threonine synthase [Patescibacteria group bacterium AH-259-L07]